MVDYDFLVLSPAEFENFTRDVLQKKFKNSIESFTSGPDGGIDLRCSINNRNTVIQAKRYKSYSSLIGNLKKEVKKVEDLRPDRYILSTSVGLSPDNKEEIKRLFSPFIRKSSDIFGRNDLNNLIGQFPQIEKKYYKLWLSSTNILDKVLHSKVYNQSAFELEDIKDQIKLYVQNNSFDQALNILNKYHYLIISGIPGIGKTTLARVLVLYLLSKEYEEFIFLNQSIDDGYELYKVEKKQVFLFDDFLGRNFLENKLLPNEDAKIIKFVDTIRKSPNKKIIFTTREYILNQAKNSFESFRIKNIELGKSILDISSYTDLIKAQILYNHLFFADIPVEHIQNLIENKTYLDVIKHPNYNPRIIETLVNRRVWNECSSNEFGAQLIGLFDNPESVWLSAFENTITPLSQYSLLVLLTLNSPVLLEDWISAKKYFCEINGSKYSIRYDSITFNRTIKELEDTFISTEKDSFDNIAIQYQNPSIQDFLVNYLRDKDDIIEDLLKASIFQIQPFWIFTTSQSNSSNKIYLKNNAQEVIKKRFLNSFSEFSSNYLYRLVLNNKKFRWRKYIDFRYSFLEDIHREFFRPGDEDLNNLLLNEFQPNIYIFSDEYSEQTSYLYLLKYLNLNRIKFSKKDLIIQFIRNIDWLDWFQDLSEFKLLFPRAYKEIISSDHIREKVKEVLEHELENLDDADIFDLQNSLEDIEMRYGLNLREESKILDEKAMELEMAIDNQVDKHTEENRFEKDDEPEMVQDEDIDEIFNTLLD